MKKICIYAVLTAVAILCAGCGKINDSQNTENTKLANTEVVTEVAVDSSEAEQTSAFDGTDFKEIPETASKPFNYLIEAVSDEYPSEGDKRLYGYIGTEKINGESCYMFTVYDVADDVKNEVVNAAVSGDSSRVYIYDSENERYTILKCKKIQTWADKITSTFAGYLSPKTETVDSVSENEAAETSDSEDLTDSSEE
jgi:hypothetical protein